MNTRTVVTTLSLLAVGASFAEDKKVELKTELPKAMFVGTPVPINLPNLEKIEVKQEPLLIPEGCTNLALEKPVTSSDELPVIGDISYLTDGDKDAADGSYVELGPNVQWIQIDLEEEATIYGIWLWHFHKNARAYMDVIVQVSDDPEFNDGVTTIYNSDHDASAKLKAGKGSDKAYVETNLGRVIDAKGAKGRYVRFYSNGNTANDMNHYIEAEVWGKKA